MTLSVVIHLCFVTLARMHNASPLCGKLNHLDFKLDRGHALLLFKLDLLCLIFKLSHARVVLCLRHLGMSLDRGGLIGDAGVLNLLRLGGYIDLLLLVSAAPDPRPAPAGAVSTAP